ncbi:MAG: ABC transporter permease [Verrucomicrobiales bacterium]|nr:ABC transporter permease [Verrucomicrobiales bacterium]
MLQHIGILLGKDLRRARRNPVPYLIHLCIPLVITGLLGMVFSSAGKGEGSLGRIRVAIVDEDDSAVIRLLRGALNQGQASEHVEARFLERELALREITNNAIAAVVVIPQGFTDHLLDGREPAVLELVKNPAQAIHPAIVEEALAVLTTGLNAIARNFGGEVAAWRPILSGERKVTLREVGSLLEQTGDHLERLRKAPGLWRVSYEKESKPETPTPPDNKTASKPGVGFNMFALLLPGMAAMFLVFLADVAMRDLQREIRFRTFHRLCTMPAGATAFVLAKVWFTLAIVILGATILMGGGTLLFGITWRQPWIVALLSFAVSVFACGFMAALTGLIGGEKKADVLNTMVGMALGMASGCTFPAEALPDFLRLHVTPLLPPAWFIGAMRHVQNGDGTSGPWILAAGKLTALGIVLALLAARLLQRRLERGLRS